MLFLMLFADPEERDLFAGLFKKYEGALRSRALKIVHNPCDAEDCVATAFEHVGPVVCGQARHAERIW